MTNVTDIIANDIDTELDTPAEVVTTAEPASITPEPTKNISLDDALAKAFEKHTPVADDGKPKGPVAETPAAQAPAKIVDPITGRESEPMKAPAGWTPLLKEKWVTIDPTVQKFISDRERDMAQTISKTADARKLEADFKSIIAPHEAVIRQFNVPATSIVKDLVGQWAAMTTGTPETRAQIIHNLITHFKPDVATLISLSQGQAPQTAANVQPDVQTLVQQELAARDEKQQEQSIMSDIEAFGANPKNEYFENVRDSMGKIVLAGLVEANTMPELFQKAYDMACANNPEIAQILQGRATAAAATAVPVQQVQSARPVASVKPSLGSGSKTKTPVRSMSIDDAVNEAFRRHTA